MAKTTTWSDPKLIVLGRGRIEEQVLLVCKGHHAGGGPQFIGVVCHTEGVGLHGHPCTGVTGS